MFNINVILYIIEKIPYRKEDVYGIRWNLSTQHTSRT